MVKNILTFLLIILLCSNNISVFASVMESYDGVYYQHDQSYDSLLGQKVGFLVEGTDTNGNIKRDEYGYLIDNFLKNDSVKNINSGFNGDYGNVRVETSSQGNIASYFPTIFDWNVPERIYELSNGQIVEGSGKDIYSDNEKNNLCTYGFTRSIDDVNDITTKLDIYGLSKDGNNLIGKDTYNSKILKNIEEIANGNSEKLNEFINILKDNSIVIENNGKHEIYNYSNYGGNLKQSIIGPNIEKYSIKAYLEKIENDYSSYDSEVKFSKLNLTKGSNLDNGKYGNYINISKEFDENNTYNENKYLIINDNNLLLPNGKLNLDINKLFTQYKDLINGLGDVDSKITKNIKDQYIYNIIYGIKNKLKNDENGAFEKGRIKNTLILIDKYLNRNGVSIPSDISNKLYNSEIYDSLFEDELSILVGAYYKKFIDTLDLKFDALYTDESGNSKIVDLDGNFRTDWVIANLDEMSTNIGFKLYSTDGEDSTYNFDKTLNYGDVGNSYGVFPNIKLKSGNDISFNMGFAVSGNIDEESKRIYNSIIGGSDLAIEYIDNKDYNYIYGLTELLKDSALKSGKLNLKLLYNSASTLDFFFKHDLNDENVLDDDNFKTLLALSFNYFNNGESYKIRDISKDKQTTKHPYVFPISYFIGKEDREYSYYSSGLKKLKDGETSYFKVCLGDGNIKNLLKATPESKVYTKKIVKNGKEYLLTYKVLEMQYKFAGELTMGTDFGLYGDMPPEESINLSNFMNNNPLKDINYNGDNLKIENFLSGKNVNIWSGFKNKTDKYSYGFRAFSKAGDNLITYKENGASNKLYDPNSGHLYNPLVNTLKKIDGNNFGNGNGQTLLDTGKKDTTMGEFNFTSDLYSSVSCPKGYDLYDDYIDVYKEIMKMEQFKGIKDDKVTNKFPLLEKLNYRKINGIEYQAITGYFNTPRPFCIHSSLSKNKETVLNGLKKMFVIDEGGDKLGDVEKYNYVLQNNTNPFLYYDENKGNFKYSTVYLNTLRSLFSSEYQRFPTYNKVSENLDKLYTGNSAKEILGYIDYSNNIDQIIDNLILYNAKKTDEESINFEAAYTTNRNKIKNILTNLNKVYFSGIYGMNLLKNNNGDYQDFSNASNAELFPVIGAVKNIKKSGIDFYCKDESGTKTNSLILKGKCYSKNTGKLSNSEKLFINYGKELALSDGAFVNNTTLLPFFKPGISIKDTSGTLFLNKNVSSQENLPFIKNIVYDPNVDDINLKPRITALRGISSSELIETQMNQGYGYRAGGFLFPYSKFISGNDKTNFNNLLINSSFNLESIQKCTNIVNFDKDTNLDNGTCSAGYIKGYNEGVYAPFIFNNGNSDNIGVKDSDYSTVNVPLSFGDLLVNKDMESYASSNLLNTKAEFVAGKSSAIVYNGDFYQKNKGSDLLTGYVKSDKNIKYGDYMFFTIDNSSTGLNNNSIFYEIKSNFLPETCLFGDDNVNSCIEEYNTFDYTLINKAGMESNESVNKMCLELDGSKRVYKVGAETENDIDQTGYCNMSCLTTTGDEKVFSSNNFYLYTKNQGDPVCLETEPNKLKIYDGYTLNNFLDKNKKSVDLGKYYSKGTGINGTGIPINSSSGTCYYNSDTKKDEITCNDGFLSRYNNEINKNVGDLKNNPAYRNSYNYSENIELGKKVSTNFNGVLNNDLIILTSNQKSLNGKEHIIEGGYIGNDNNIVDKITGGIKESYVFSDNDNTKGEGQVFNNSSLINTNTKTGRQERRDRVKEQLKLSAGTSNELLTNPTGGLNYIAYKVNKNDFYSLNGVLRISKDSTKYFTNVKLQNPENEKELLSDVKIFDTIFSYNNLTIKYGNKFYTWGNNDTSCNGKNPNEVYNKVDMYSGDKKTSREDTMTLCLSNKNNLSEKHDLNNDIFILLPIKPTKGYNKYNINGTIEIDNDSNSLINNVNGFIDARKTTRDNKFNLNTYYQGYFTNEFNVLDSKDNFLEVSDGNTITTFSDRAVKGRKVDLNIENSARKSCYYVTCGSKHCTTHTVNYYEYRGTGTKSYNVNFKPNKIILNNTPKTFISSFITKQTKDKSIFSLPIFFSNTKSTFSNNSSSNNIGYTRFISPLSYASCKNIWSGVGQAQEQVKRDMFSIAHIHNQSEISNGSSVIESNVGVFNKGNVINSFYIPPVENMTNYSNNIQYKNVIKDSYYKAGNLLNNLGMVKSNENYVKGSLKENNYKINVGDYLEFEQNINVTAEINPQLMFVKTQLDRGLDLDISTLEFEKNGYKQYPIFANDDENKKIIGTRFNIKYIISNINSSSSNEENVFKSVTSNKYNENISLKKNNKITVTNGKLFLEILSPTAKVYGTKGTKYWRGHTTDISLIFERNNGITKQEDLGDIFTDLGTNLQKGDILTIGAGEYIRFADDNINVKVLGINSLSEYLLSYDREKVLQKDQIVGIPFLNSGFNKLDINPSKTQPYYIFKCDRLEDEQKFRKSNTTINFTDDIGNEYCGVYNKYSDLVFNGYLNAMSSYNRSILPSEEYRFSYGDESDEDSKLIGQHAKFNNISLARTSRGYMDGDREKQLLVNLGVVKKGDVIKIRYKAKVNKFNDNGHILYNYKDLNSKSIQVQGENNDNLLGNIFTKNNDIYSKSLNSQLYFFSHYGDEINIFDKEQSFEDSTSIKSKLEITPNIDLSVINLSGRKGYVGCNPINETTGKCDQFNSIETLNRDGEDNTSKGEVIKKDGESQAILYKGQKFIIRSTITNNFINKGSVDNQLTTLKLKLGYNSDLVLFDGVVIENNFNSDKNLLQNSNGKKATISPVKIDNELKDKLEGRKAFIQDILNSKIESSYKQINYNIDVSKYNNEGGVTVDYLFTLKNTLNAENIKDLFGTAFLKDIGGIFVLSSDFDKVTNKEYIYPTNNGNNVYSESYDYEGTKSIQISNLFKNDTNPEVVNINKKGGYSFQYFKMPFTDNYKYLDENKDIITELNPKTAVFNARIVNIGGSADGVYNGDSTDGKLALELTLSNTSNSNINITQDSLLFSLPNGFELDKIEYSSLDDSSKVNTKIVTEELYGKSDSTSIKQNKDYGKKTYSLTQKSDSLIPGEKVQYLIYLNVDKNSVDLFSSFTANIGIISNLNLITLFTDTGINVEKGLGDLTIKSLPIISENDAYYGVGFIKNKVTNIDLIENNNGNSGYNVIAGHGSQLDYSGTNAKNKVLDGAIQPQIYNITDITNEKKNTYSVVKGDELTNNSNIEFISGGNPHYLIKPDINGEIHLTNNTLYYFGEYDVYIGDYNSELGEIKINADTNINKQNYAGITLFTKGNIDVNNNIKLFNTTSKKLTDINYVAFMGNNISINPRVSYIEGTYSTPLTNNAYMEIEYNGNTINYNSSGNIGVIRPGYSNIPLVVKGNVIGGNIIRERTINEVIDNENITEKYEFDYKLYLSIPPVIRK